MSKRGLGKGLNALIPEVDVSDRETITEVEISRIVANRKQPRKEFDQAKLEELAASIREHGVVQPIILRPKGEQYEIVAGERRFRAAKLAELERIPSLIRDFDEAKTLEIALIENLQREDLNALEEAEAYRVLLDEFKLTQDEIARRVGKSRPQITNTLRLLNLGPEVRQELAGGRLSVGHAKVLLSLEDGAAQKRLAAKVVKEGMSVRELEQVVAEAARGDDSPARLRRPVTRRSPDLLDLEERLRQVLGTPVRVLPGNPKGRIEINYFGLEDLERIVEALLQTGAGPGVGPTAPGPFRV